MKRPWQIWLAFLLCLAVVLSAMGWVSLKMLGLEQANVAAQRKAAYEETVRLALWRMDSAISPLIIEESARPYFEYNAFNPASVVYAHAPNQWRGDELVPSRLLTTVPSNVIVHFNGEFVGGKGGYRVTSPQVPTGELLNVAVDNYGIDRDITGNKQRLDTFLADVTLEEIRQAIDPAQDNDIPMQVAMVDQGDMMQQAANMAVQMETQQRQQTDVQQIAMSQQPQQFVAQQQDDLNQQEFSARNAQSANNLARIQGSKAQQYKFESSFRNNDAYMKGQVQPPPGKIAAFAEIKEDIMRPLWVDDFLVLARDVKIDDRHMIQGAWLNWQGIKRELLTEIRDLLPEADLVRVVGEASVDRSRMLAALPVRLIAGPPAALPPVLEPPLRIPLLIAWCCVLTAAIAVGLLLTGAVSLSERRAAFVSAVTHELRTPLTTFRMYTEMLTEGMVKDPEKQSRYLNTLSAEGDRLSHLVENVLSYARLERGRPGGNEEVVAVSALVERMQERLQARATQSGMTLEVEMPRDVTNVRMKTDTQAVEQILFNLVDNACKYACGAEDRMIHLSLKRDAGKVVFRVRDHGPGILASEARKLFRPFCKSAQHAAESAPGVGLGLTLSRRLARQRGGDLELVAGETGACFELSLPALRVFSDAQTAGKSAVH